jgi:hypothetical protein
LSAPSKDSNSDPCPSKNLPKQFSIALRLNKANYKNRYWIAIYYDYRLHHGPSNSRKCSPTRLIRYTVLPHGHQAMISVTSQSNHSGTSNATRPSHSHSSAMT